MSGQVLVSIFAVVVSLLSFSFAWRASIKAARAEEIKDLLGEKEEVGFAAVKLLRVGLPGEPYRQQAAPRRFWWTRNGRRAHAQRAMVIAALMAACLFESSDRARALLFKVIERYRDSPFREEFIAQYASLKAMVDSMQGYGFTKDEFDPSSAARRLEAVRKVLRIEASLPNAPQHP